MKVETRSLYIGVLVGCCAYSWAQIIELILLQYGLYPVELIILNYTLLPFVFTFALIGYSYFDKYFKVVKK